MILKNYVAKASLYANLGVTSLILILQIVFKFLAGLTEINQDFTLIKLVLKTLYEVPEILYYQLPTTSLIGTVVALSLFANNSELTIMRAVGISIWKIISWALIPIVLIMIFGLLLSEYIIPNSNQQAMNIQSQSNNTQTTIQGFWAKNKNEYIYVNYANKQGQLFDVKVVDLDEKSRINKVTTANTADYKTTTQWVLKNPKQYNITTTGNMVLGINAQPVIVDIGLQPQQLHLMTLSPEVLSPTQLYTVAKQLKKQGNNNRAYILEWYKHITYPLSILLLSALACTFVFGSLRQKTMGYRLVVAIFVGLAFNYLQDLFGYASLVYTMSPAWFVITPLFVIACITYWSIKKAG